MANPKKYAVSETTGVSQQHYYPGEYDDGPIDNTLDMVFLHSGYRMRYGHHVRLGSGNDTFNFVGVNEVGEVKDAGNLVVGRLEDFDPTRDKIQIDGVTLDLNNLPSNARVVRYNGDHNDTGSDPQQWLLITNKHGGHIFYALEGARIDVDGNGGSNDAYQEEHFITKIPDFNTLATVKYENPFNYVPTGFLPNGGKVIQDFEVANPTGDRPGDQALADVTTPLLGTTGGDLIAGGLNGDIVKAGAGMDRVWGGDGNDFLYGEDHNDILYGNAGKDTLNGDAGNDQLFGNNGNDYLNGGSGSNTLTGGAGNDIYVVYTTTNVIVESANSGTDVVSAGISFDLNTLSNVENVVLRGDAGDAYAYGSTGSNVVTGNSGDNVVLGRGGNDTLTGAAGSDTFHFSRGWDADIINDFQDNVDTIRLRALGIDNFTEARSYATQSGSNVIFDFGGGDLLTVRNATISSLADDMIFTAT